MNTLLFKIPVKGDRYYSRSEMLTHLAGMDRKLLTPGFRKENHYTIVDYLVVKCVSCSLITSAAIGIGAMAHSFFLYRNDYFSSHPFFQELYDRDTLGFTAYYGFYHALAATPFVILICCLCMLAFAINAKPGAIVFLNFETHLTSDKSARKSFAKHGRAMLLLGILGLIFSFAAPAMVVDWFYLPQAVGDSPFYAFLGYCFITAAHGVAALMLFLSFLFFYAPRAGFIPSNEEKET